MSTVVTHHGEDHPLRSRLSSEMHMRKLPRFCAPAHVVQVVYFRGDMFCEHELQSALLHLGDSASTDVGRQFHAGRLDDVQLCWEMHSEFCTVTLIASSNADDPLDLSAINDSAMRISCLPGLVFRSTNIAIVPATGRDWSHYFSEEDLVVSEVFDGRARIWSDFRLHDDGFGRMLIEDCGLVGREQVDVVQWLQELGNYRKMALLGLPIAQEQMARLDTLEGDLAQVSLTLADDDAHVDELMSRLGRISSDLARISAESRYRMAATRAYAAIVDERLASLGCSAQPGQVSLAHFTDRRLRPAVRTCEAFSRRLQEMTRNAAEVSDLLRTLIDTELARRNAELLTSMDRRTELQLRLQQTVEGVSIVAITYYALGIWKYLTDHGPLALDRTVSSTFTVALAIVTPIAIWWLLHRARHGRHGG